jgi:prepilin-type N-terminal cleavage/methylation domain-containing protein
MHTKSQRGFTLIELLVVIAIIGILASVILVSLNSARAKAGDAKRISELNSIQTALQLYYNNKGAMPPNHTPGSEVSDNDPTFLQELVTDGEFTKIPRSSDPSNPYGYYDYGPGSIGALIVTNLVAAAPTTTGYAGTCRPWALGTNWCDASNSKAYCVCNPY